MSPAPATTTTNDYVVPTDWFRWMPAAAAIVLSDAPLLAYGGGSSSAQPTSEASFALPSDARDYGSQLSSMLQLRGIGAVRLGWLFLAGSFTDDAGRARQIFHPLISAEVRITSLLGSVTVHRFGDTRVSPLINDADRHRLEQLPVEVGGGGLTPEPAVHADLLARMPKLKAFATELARSAGFPKVKIVPAKLSPDEFMRRPEVVVVAGLALYAAESDPSELSRAASLRSWDEKDLHAPTALHTVYSIGDERPVAISEAPVISPLSLTPSQSAAVRSARTAPLTVISGAPGTGKSHTLAAIALDAVNRGENALIVAKTNATVDALTDLLDKCAGPTPVVFGADERRRALADTLAAGAIRPVSDAELANARERARKDHAALQEIRAAMVAQLEAEERLRLGIPIRADDEALAVSRLRGEEVRAALRAYDEAGRFGRRGHWKELRRALALSKSVPDDMVRREAGEFLIRLAARELLAEGGHSLTTEWDELAASEERAREAVGEAMLAESRSLARLDTGALNAVNALAVALRSGRGVRREQLRKLRQADVTRALPLWIGTLADVDDLLPPLTGYFDLVILDEAASIDQPLAAPALLRGKRAVVAGDPRQLRQVSFLGDKDHDAAMRATWLDEEPVLAARLDVRRNSALDLAMGAAPPVILDEHFRSDPHLIEFVMRRLYNDDVKVASRRPTTHRRDCIDVVRVKGGRDATGIVQSELAQVIKLLANNTKAPSVGVVTPFRAQADAIEEAVLDRFSHAEIMAMDLRVGTVHGFQGNERDLVIVSVGVGDSDTSPWRFVEDIALLAVMLTRARRKLIVVLAGEPPKHGLFADFLAQADAPPGPPAPGGAPASAWVNHLIEGLADSGIAMLPRYPSGRHVADIVVDDDTRDVAVEAEIHPNGVESHIRRRLEMMSRGWRFEEAFRSQWLGREAELVVDLAQRLKRSDS